MGSFCFKALSPRAQSEYLYGGGRVSGVGCWVRLFAFNTYV